MKRLLSIFLVCFSLIPFAEVKAQSGSKFQTYSITREVKGSYDEIVAKLNELLKENKFAVVTEVKISETINQKLGKDVKKHTILGVCNVQHAYDLTNVDPRISLLLPCKMSIRELSADNYEVAMVNPYILFGITENAELKPYADEITKTLRGVLDKL